MVSNVLVLVIFSCEFGVGYYCLCCRFRFVSIKDVSVKCLIRNVNVGICCILIFVKIVLLFYSSMNRIVVLDFVSVVCMECILFIC